MAGPEEQEKQPAAARTQLMELQELAGVIGARFDTAAEHWTLPYYVARRGRMIEQRMPVMEWIRSRQVAAIAIEKMLLEREGYETEAFDMAEPEPIKWSGDVEADNWKHRSAEMKCRTCMFYVPKITVLQKDVEVGRCRERSP